VTKIANDPVHAYGGLEHSQPGPFSECLLCRIEELEAACRAAEYALNNPEGGFNREEALDAIRGALRWGQPRSSLSTLKMVFQPFRWLFWDWWHGEDTW